MEQHLSKETALWVKSASPADLACVIECGYKAMSHFCNISPKTDLLHPLVKPKTDLLHPLVKGDIGESYVYDILKTKYQVIDTSGQKSSGDIHVVHNGKKILIEVKNYTNTIPTSEVTKFYNDVVATKVNAGVFISLQSQITGIEHMQFVNNLVPCIFMATNNKDLILSSIELILIPTPSAEYAPITKIQESLTKFSKSRLALQSHITTIFNSVVIFSSQASLLENEIKTNLALLPTPVCECDKINNFAMQPQFIREYIVDIIKLVSQYYGDSWKYTTKAAKHANGISLLFNTTSVTLNLPRSIIDIKKVIEYISACSDKITISTEISFIISHITYTLAVSLLTP